VPPWPPSPPLASSIFRVCSRPINCSGTSTRTPVGPKAASYRGRTAGSPEHALPRLPPHCATESLCRRGLPPNPSIKSVPTGLWSAPPPHLALADALTRRSKRTRGHRRTPPSNSLVGTASAATPATNVSVVSP
jgi:hypothetical protein